MEISKSESVLQPDYSNVFAPNLLENEWMHRAYYIEL